MHFWRLSIAETLNNCIDDVQISLSLKSASVELASSNRIECSGSTPTRQQDERPRKDGLLGWRCERSLQSWGCLLRGDKGLVNSDVTREGGTGTCPDVADLGYADVPIVEAWAELPVWPRCVSSSVEEGF
ncbi:hypothetical protein BDV41DRAFT_4552 [Aspergillus transmontanensis]|uniref:Uncharacterized protein n=1 Tax=Aspergillus transmontanensis TaxID=1034304 RepID=A0A5N6WK95_9EURO|nr:hypothetical protein BDV41DRAFT_4552 [Aspergillus transmontanensis]